MPRRLVAVTLWFGTLTVPVPSLAYDLGYHEDITKASLRRAGYTANAQRMVTNYNLAVDIKVNTIGLVTNYLHDEHFDDRFQWSMHRALREKLLSDLGRLRTLDCEDDDDDTWTFGAAMGLLHHAIQDYYAHSNHAELVGLYGGNLETYDDVMQPVPTMAVLNSVWLADVPTTYDESLLSGAYFVEPPPKILDAQGREVDLTHDILHKDQPRVRGAYLYDGRVDRRSAHSRSVEMAARDLVQLDARFRSANRDCHRLLKEYDFSWYESIEQGLKYRALQLAGIVTTHWRSGSHEVVAAGISATITAPVSYPDPPGATAWTYAVHNTGSEPITSISLSARERLLVQEPVAPPAGWTVAREGDALVLRAAPGGALPPGETLRVEIQPDAASVPGLIALTTDAGWTVEALGPVPQDYVDASLIRAAAILADVDVDAALDQAGVPASARTLPAPPAPPPIVSPPTQPAPPQGCGCRAATGPWGGLAAVSGLLLLVGRRRRR